MLSDTSSEPFALSFSLTQTIFSIQTQTRDTFFSAPLIRSVIQNPEERSKLIISLCACAFLFPQEFLPHAFWSIMMRSGPHTLNGRRGLQTQGEGKVQRKKAEDRIGGPVGKGKC